MKILHVKSLRRLILAMGICVAGLLLAYLSGGIVADKAPVQTTAPNIPTVELELDTPEETPAEIPEEAPTENTEEPVKTSAANYYVRLNRGLSSSEEKLLVEQPSQLKTSVEYRGKTTTQTLKEEDKINQILSLLSGAERLADDTKIVSTSNSHDVTLTLPYVDGFGNLYIFEGYPNGAKKSVTLIQDNLNHLYQAKTGAVNQLYDLLKPVESTLGAERLNLYGAHNFEKGSLQAQVKKEADHALMLQVLNSLEKRGSSLEMDSPDYLVTLLPSNSVQEKEFCYLWLDEKNVHIAFADDSITVYEATDVTSSQMKKWVKEHKVK